jgi:hypothetical protein
MADQWVVTWEPAGFAVVGSKILPPARKHEAFDSQKEAVNFLIGLTDAERRTVQLHMPGAIAKFW